MHRRTSRKCIIPRIIGGIFFVHCIVIITIPNNYAYMARVPGHIPVQYCCTRAGTQVCIKVPGYGGRTIYIERARVTRCQLKVDLHVP